MTSLPAMPAFTSLATLLQDLRASFHLLVLDAGMPAGALHAQRHAARTLKQYLYALKHAPATKRTTPQEVLAAFTAWKTAQSGTPQAQQWQHSAERYLHSLETMLQNPAALSAARKDIAMSLSEWMEEE